VARQMEVEAVDEGRRLDRYLEKFAGGLPTSLVRRLLRQRRVRVNGKRVRNPAHRLVAGDRLEIHHEFPELDPPREDRRRWSGPAPAVLHRDDEWLVVNKPAGVACSDDGTDPRALAVWLNETLSEEISAGLARPEPCHRLDRGTTGAVAVALSPRAFDRFRQALAGGKVHKAYEVVVEGVPKAPEFRCDVSLDRRARTGPREPRMVPGSSFDALTRFRMLRTNGRQSLLQAEPVTGRTHQIRAHCRALGLPVLGDPRYGSDDDAVGPGHQLLHARDLALDGEGGFRVAASWPEPEIAWLRRLGLSA
jgi:23S rRNA pseudouridine955/2504/2580 synthase